YAVASLVAIALGVVLGLSPALYRAVNPYIQILKPISPPAWMPLFLYTIRDSGWAAVLVIFMSSLWPTLANTAFGVVNIRRDYLHVAAILQLPWWRRLMQVILPAAAPAIVAGLEQPSAGGVVLSGREITGPGMDRMVVFQNFSLMPWMTVFDNIRLAVRAAHPDWSRRRVAEWVQRYVDMVGLTGAEAKRPAALSGGMRQRVGLARAFSTEPKVLLLDEPFAQIDALTRGVIQDELVRMWSASRNTVFMVTHDVDEAILLSDRIALMTKGPNA